MKPFIIKVLVKVIFLCVLFTILGMITNSPIITNELALGQMSNSQEGFIALNAYQNLKPYVESIIYVVAIAFLLGIAHDSYRFIKKYVEEKKGSKDI